MYLTDLTFIEDGNNDTFTDPQSPEPLVHFFKCRLQAVVIQAIQQYQQKPYFFEKQEVILQYLANLEARTDDELFELSLEQEPRENT